MARIIPVGNLEITDDFFAQLQAEDDELRFSRFEHDDAIAVGQHILTSARKRGQSIAAAVWLGDQVVFQFGLAGTSPDSDRWIARKVATVRRYNASSFMVAAMWASDGKVPDAVVGVDSIQYAYAGGAVPIRIGATQVGVAAATGVGDFVEHDLVVEALRAHLGS